MEPIGRQVAGATLFVVIGACFALAAHEVTGIASGSLYLLLMIPFTLALVYFWFDWSNSVRKSIKSSVEAFDNSCTTFRSHLMERSFFDCVDPAEPEEVIDCRYYLMRFEDDDDWVTIHPGHYFNGSTVERASKDTRDLLGKAVYFGRKKADARPSLDMGVKLVTVV